MAAVGYTNAGTVEFLMDETGKLYFIEVNARIQVEHPVTELVTGVDLVKSQIRIAQGETPAEMCCRDRSRSRGHAIECRINAEHPETFAPSPGRITGFNLPGGIGVRVDTAAYTDGVIPPYYDSLVAKLITHGNDRAEAIQRMQRALEMFIVEGIHTSIPLHQKILADPDFQAGQLRHELHQTVREVIGRPTANGNHGAKFAPRWRGGPGDYGIEQKTPLVDWSAGAAQRGRPRGLVVPEVEVAVLECDGTDQSAQHSLSASNGNDGAKFAPKWRGGPGIRNHAKTPRRKVTPRKPLRLFFLAFLCGFHEKAGICQAHFFSSAVLCHSWGRPTGGRLPPPPMGPPFPHLSLPSGSGGESVKGAPFLRGLRTLDRFSPLPYNRVPGKGGRGSQGACPLAEFEAAPHARRFCAPLPR